MYALLSLAETTQNNSLPALVPDYSLSEIDVFRLATIHCIYTPNERSVFSTELERKFRADLPYWVPDWSAPGGHTYSIRAQAVSLYSACATGTSITQLASGHASSSGLVVRARQFGLVKKIGEVMWGDNFVFCRKTRSSWLLDLNSSATIHPMDDKIGFWRLIYADVVCMSQAPSLLRRANVDDGLCFVPKVSIWSLRRA